ncbi:hypothetical protein Bhyg_05903 [Pseudolycoriella hygida]|uniref:Uncharacterized protein n=1 Tax=Pseudolycoriella hygida TaxID=35572 RepID=A0A9Q0MZS6_9DIPT|nr:hypothetical protein Bhyg_05903 [Pseudolycoriella hygida]
MRCYYKTAEHHFPAEMYILRDSSTIQIYLPLEFQKSMYSSAEFPYRLSENTVMDIPALVNYFCSISEKQQYCKSTLQSTSNVAIASDVNLYDVTNQCNSMHKYHLSTSTQQLVPYGELLPEEQIQLITIIPTFITNISIRIIIDVWVTDDDYRLEVEDRDNNTKLLVVGALTRKSYQLQSNYYHYMWEDTWKEAYIKCPFEFFLFKRDKPLLLFSDSINEQQR